MQNHAFRVWVREGVGVVGIGHLEREAQVVAVMSTTTTTTTTYTLLLSYFCLLKIDLSRLEHRVTLQSYISFVLGVDLGMMFL